MADNDINILVLVKEHERYVFLFDDHNRVEMLRTLERFASDAELSFTWYDAATLALKIREMRPSSACDGEVGFGRG